MLKSAISMLALIWSATAVAAIDSDWPVLTEARDGPCRLTVTGNGKITRIAGEGLGPATPARYRLENGSMRALDWAIRTNDAGQFARYYLPFQWGQRGGDVAIEITSDQCRLRASFSWERQRGDPVV